MLKEKTDVKVKPSYQRNSKGFAFYKGSRKYWEIDCEDGENSHEHHMGSVCSECLQGRDPDQTARRRG